MHLLYAPPPPPPHTHTHTDQDIYKLESVQHRAARWVTGDHQYTSVFIFHTNTLHRTIIPTQCYYLFSAILIGPYVKLNGFYTSVKTRAYEYLISSLISQSSMPTHISVWGYMYPLVFPFGGTCSFLRVHIF